jgi:hypothetical protein
LLMHYGFVQPFPAMILIPVAAALALPGWVAAGVVAGFVGLLVGGEELARKRALGQVRQWAAARGLRDVRARPRGGFVSWGWSVWSFAEIRRYEGTTADGSPVGLLASHYAPAFGLVVFTRCEAWPGTSPGRDPM